MYVKMEFGGELFLVLTVLMRLVMYCEGVRFSQFSNALKVVEHDKVVMECEVINKLPNHKVQWTRAGTKRTTTTTEDDQTYKVSLTIKSVARSDKGEYVCEILEDDTLIDKQILVLTVQEIPQKTYPICGELPTTTEGQEVTLTCSSEKANPTPVLKWYRKDKFNDSLYELDTGDMQPSVLDKKIQLDLTFTPTAINNKDIYVCKLTTNADKEWENDCQRVLHVRVKPIVNISGSPVVNIGRETVFICESQTKAEYKWNFSIPTSRVRLEADNQILRYQNPRPEDEGKEITCVATNDVGSSSMTLRLYVTESVSEISYGPTQSTGFVHSSSSNARSLSFVIAVAGGCTISLLALLLLFAVCVHFHTNRELRNTSLVAQPDVYFEPRDRVLQMPSGSCMRSVGVQVPRDIELEFVYHEIESRKSGSSCSARNYSTGATSV